MVVITSFRRLRNFFTKKCHPAKEDLRFRWKFTEVKKIDSKIELLVYRFLRGELSVEEREELDGWLQDGKHREWFERIRNRENILQKSFHFDQLNKGRKECWRRLEKSTGLWRRRVMRRWMLTAASLMIPLLVGLLYHDVLWNNEPLMREKKMEIVPGGASAMLYLPDGKVVDLGRDSVCALKLAGGGTFLNERGTLTYRKDSAKGRILRYSELRIPRGGEYKVILPDGTTVWLNAESSLRFPNEFTGKTRKVYASGELYFDVSHDEMQPFEVNVEEGYTIEVLGTEFNVRAYRNSPCATTLVKGNVRVKGKDHEVLLKPGQQAVATDDGKSIEVKDIDVAPCVAWHNGLFHFEQVPLKDIMEELSRWYDVQVFFENESVKNECFTLEMRRFDDFNRVLNLIEHTGMVKITVNEHVVTVR